MLPTSIAPPRRARCGGHASRVTRGGGGGVGGGGPVVRRGAHAFERRRGWPRGHAAKYRRLDCAACPAESNRSFHPTVGMRTCHKRDGHACERYGSTRKGRGRSAPLARGDLSLSELCPRFVAFLPAFFAYFFFLLKNGAAASAPLRVSRPPARAARQRLRGVVRRNLRALGFEGSDDVLKPFLLAVGGTYSSCNASWRSTARTRNSRTGQT